MREISYKNLVPGTLYYIQRERNGKGNGKQKGIFMRKKQNSPEDLYFCVFQYVEDVVGSSGWVNGRSPGISPEFDYYCSAGNAKFYLPEKQEIEQKMEIRLTNQVLQQIIGDPYFTFYDITNQ